MRRAPGAWRIAAAALLLGSVAVAAPWRQAAGGATQAPEPGTVAQPAGGEARQRADALFDAVELAAAAEAYAALVQASPEEPALRVRLAECLTRTDRFVEAEAQARRAVELGGGAAARAGLGKALHRKGDFDAAREAFREGLEADGECAECLWGLGRIQAIHGEYGEAGESLQRAAALEPDNPVFLRTLAPFVADRERQKEIYRRYLELPRREEETVWENARAWLAMLEHAGDRPIGVVEIPDAGAEVPVLIQGVNPYITVRLGEKPKLRYLYDTGASGFTISRRMRKRLGLEPVNAYTITGIGGKGTSETEMVLVPEVRVGQAVIRNVPAVVSDSIPGMDGLLGPTLFGGATVTLDPARRRLRLEPLTSAGPAPPREAPPQEAATDSGARKRDAREAAVTIPFLSINGTPFIPIQVDGVPMHAMVDTGGSQAVLSSFAAERSGVRFLPPELAPPAYQEIRGATGRWSDVRVAHRAALQVAGQSLDMGAHVPDPGRVLVSYDLTPLSHGMGTEIWAILGYPQLDEFRLTLDWGRQVVILEPLR